MAKRDQKKGGILLIKGLDISVPAEYIDDNAARNSENFELSRGVLSKRVGTTQLGSLIYSSVLTFGANAADTNTVTIGAKVYTFQTSLTDVDGNVLIGANAEASIDNLVAAINLAAGAGTTYATSMTAHPNGITAAKATAATMSITVNMTSAIATTDTLANGSWTSTVTATATELEIMGGREFDREGVNYNVRVGLDRIERYNSSTEAWVDITGTDLTGTSIDLVDTAIPLLSGSRILCITNGIDAIRKWTATGNTADLGGTPPVAKFIQEYKTYLVCANIAGGTDIAERVQWCDTADPENWSTGNAGTVDLVEDGEDITGLSLFGAYLCVHKPRSIYLGYLVSSSAIFLFDRKATGVGTVANGSIQNLPSGEQIFLAKDGIYLFNGVNCRSLSPLINEEIRDGLSSEYASKSWSILVREKKEVWIGIPIGSQTSGETVYKYNYETGVVLKDTRTDANAAWTGESTAGLTWDEMTGTWDANVDRWDASTLGKYSDTINISDVNGYTYKVSSETANDDGVAVSATFVSKDYQDSQQSIARFNKLELWAKGSTIKVEYSVDQGETWVEASGSPFSLTDSYPQLESPDVFYFDVVSSQIRFRFSNITLGETLAIKQFIINYTVRENRR